VCCFSTMFTFRQGNTRGKAGTSDRQKSRNAAFLYPYLLTQPFQLQVPSLLLLFQNLRLPLSGLQFSSVMDPRGAGGKRSGVCTMIDTVA
jgi:hypothetical protein